MGGIECGARGHAQHRAGLFDFLLHAGAQAQIDLQQRESAYNALMLKSLQRAYELFEGKLAEREEPGRQLKSARELFDLWIDAAEEAYADIALSPEFREVYGALVNAQMRLRAGVQKEVELAGAMFGMPTRTELDSAHRKIAELERQLRRLQRKADDAAPAAASAAKPAVKKPATRSRSVKQAAKPVAKKAVAKKILKKPAKKTAARRPVARKR